MLQKFNTPGLMLMVVAGLAIGLTMPSVKAVKYRGGEYGVEYPDKTIQPAQVYANQISDKYSMNIDPAAKQQLGEQAFNEVTMFFRTAEKAIETKNLPVLMAQYSDRYQDGELDKQSVEQAWRRIFARVDTVATLNNMTLVNISPDRNRVVLQSSGLLVGVHDPEKGPVTIDNWNKQNHILIKKNGEWKLVGIYGPEQKRLWFDKPMHPLI